MKTAGIILLTVAVLAGWGHAGETPAAGGRPNIVYILADDLGYGDVHCLNPQRGKIATPNIDRLASQGMVFTDAHGSSSVCTPSRYSILTGRYNWRSRLQKGVLDEYGRTLIEKDRLTVAEFLRRQGYATAAIGKWHLGWDWHKGYDFRKAIGGGPTTVGFDYYFGTDVPNFPPFCFIENDRTVGIPSVEMTKQQLKPYSTGKTGIALPGWQFEPILPKITEKACGFIARNAKAGKPFFLYFPMTSPHTPLAVNPEWLGKSGLGRYADFVMETDAMVGRVLDTIEKSGVSRNTLVVFASDNGCAPYIGVQRLEAKGHYPSAQFRGYKSDAWDGGHRIPFIASWPGVVKEGSTCGQMVCQMDLMATCAQILGLKLPEDAGVDSVSLLPLLKGENKPTRELLVHHSIKGNFAIREGKWKLILCAGSGGWSDGPKAPAVQLYDMSMDESERKNMEAEHPEIVKRLKGELERIVADGRSTPGKKQKNDVAVNIFKKSAEEGVTTDK